MESLSTLAKTLSLRIAAAESVTGGRVQARLTAISGASSYFVGGITAYEIAQKVKLLGVSEAEAEACNAVSREVAQQMACGACSLFESDVAVATTGYAEPDHTRGAMTPCAWMSVAVRGGKHRPRNHNGPFELTTKFVETSGSREEAQAHFADHAIALLHGVLLQLKES